MPSNSNPVSLFNATEQALIDAASALDHVDQSESARLIRARLRNLTIKYEGLAKRARFMPDHGVGHQARAAALRTMLDQIT